MSRRAGTLAPDYFEGLYIEDPDPWRFASSDYEREKYAHTLSALPEARYANALEIGCSIGVLTRDLAARCDRLVAIDAAATPLIQARERCHGLDHVEFAQMFVPGQWPQGAYDLILLSEVVYYLDAEDVAALAGRVAASANPGAAIVLVHWTGETDYPLSGDEAAALFMASLGDRAQSVVGERRAQYRLDILKRR